MANIKTKKSDLYIPPKAGDLYPQLKPTKHKPPSFLESKISEAAADVDASTGQRKYWRFVVDSNKPVCVTILGLEDELDDTCLVIDQIFGPPSCETRKALLAGSFDENCKPIKVPVCFNNQRCQLVFNKPGRYEIRDADFELFPVGSEVVQRSMSIEAARLLGEQGTVFAL